MRERGTQVRRARLTEAGSRTPPPRSPGGGSFWPAVAIVAIILATAGWTVVAVMALNGPSATADASDIPSDDPSDLASESEDPVVETHTFPDLESLLPSGADGVEFDVQSWAAGLYAENDGMTDSVIAALTAAGKTEADFQAALAADPGGELDGIVSVYRAEGVSPDVIRDAMVADLKAVFPEFATTTETVAERSVTRGGEPETDAIWWAYSVGEYLFVIESSDDDLATRILSTLSAGPATSVPPAPTAAPTPIPSADPSAS